MDGVFDWMAGDMPTRWKATMANFRMSGSGSLYERQLRLSSVVAPLLLSLHGSQRRNSARTTLSPCYRRRIFVWREISRSLNWSEVVVTVKETESTRGAHACPKSCTLAYKCQYGQCMNDFDNETDSVGCPAIRAHTAILRRYWAENGRYIR